METLSFSRMGALEGGAYKHWVAGKKRIIFFYDALALPSLPHFLG